MPYKIRTFAPPIANESSQPGVSNEVEKERNEHLSEREKQIAYLAAEGLTDKEIARKLKVSVTTIRTYWMRIRRKVGATNRAQAIVKAIESNGVTSYDSSFKREAVFTRLLASCALGIVATSPAGTLLSANDAFLCMVGLDRASFERDGLTWKDLLAPDASDDLTPQDSARVKLLRHRDGHILQVVWIATRLDEANGIDVSCFIDLGESDGVVPGVRNAGGGSGSQSS